MVYTDHKPLKSLFTKDFQNTKVQRWGVLLAEYGAKIEYRKAVFTRATFGLFVARHRDWRRRPTHKPLSRRLSAEVEHVPILAKK